ncbi:MAG: VRR-NUC domain-containing protein, partial [Caulobacteraceae bacterium]|nr:VRR-NUC domain-containing protein [Caulobacteraceae bacterium]
MGLEEFKLQAQCFRYHWNERPQERGRLFTVNNNSGGKFEGAIMKAMGVVAGVAD